MAKSTTITLRNLSIQDDDYKKEYLEVESAFRLIIECIEINNISPQNACSAMINIFGAYLSPYPKKYLQIALLGIIEAYKEHGGVYDETNI